MRIARYWARAYVTIDGVEDPRGGVVGLGWSDLSADAAKRAALEKARRTAATLRGDGALNASEYPYPDRPMREPVIDEMHHADRRVAVITRNTYGALVLNTANAMFIDIDAPLTRGGWLQSLRKGNVDRDRLAQDTADKLNMMADADPNMGFRLYQTAAGLRVLVTGRMYDPRSDEATDVMNALGSDSRYMRLCRVQDCFRARLTPKPWRCGVCASPWTFPYEDERRREDFEAWQRMYEQASASHGVCELIAEIGRRNTNAEISPIVIFHDELTCRDGLPLA